MIAVQMAYAVSMGLMLAAVGVMLERVAALKGHPRRWVWAGTLLAMIVLVGALPWRVVSSAESTVAKSSVVVVDRSDASAIISPGGALKSQWSVVRDRLRSGADAAAAAVAGLDAAGRWTWTLTSLAMLLICSLGQWTLSRRRRQWRVDCVHGVSVLVAPQDGPAVIGVMSPKIVLPEWALDLEPQAIDLMIRHEREHDDARDPLLIHLAAVVLLAMPWNPAAWWMVSRLRLAVELDCDARVLGSARDHGRDVFPETAVYGELLLAVAARRSPRRALVAPAFLEHSSSLRRRISAMYSTHLRLRGLRAAGASGAALALVAITLGLPVPRLLAHASAPAAAIMPSVAPSNVIAANPPNAPRPSVVRVAPVTARVGKAPQSRGRSETTQTDPVYPIGNGVSGPVLLIKLDPTYTSAALAAKIEGEVWLDGVVEKNGLLSNLSVKKSLDPTLGLDQSALDAASKWTFRPGTKDGQPVRVSVQLILEFRLQPSTYSPGTPGLVSPQIKDHPDPTYTSEALRAKIQGTVRIQAVVKADGTVGPLRIIQSLDTTYGLDDAALAAAKQWTFEPGTLNGKPVPVSVTLSLEFRLH